MPEIDDQSAAGFGIPVSKGGKRFGVAFVFDEESAGFGECQLVNHRIVVRRERVVEIETDRRNAVQPERLMGADTARGRTMPWKVSHGRVITHGHGRNSLGVGRFA